MVSISGGSTIHRSAGIEPLVAALDRAGYRLTEPRRAVAELIAAREGHFTAADLLDDAKARRLGIGRATIFRALDLFTELSVLERLDLPTGEHAYVPCEPAPPPSHRLLHLRTRHGGRRCRPRERRRGRSSGAPAGRSSPTGSSCTAAARAVGPAGPRRLAPRPEVSPWSASSTETRYRQSPSHGAPGGALLSLALAAAVAGPVGRAVRRPTAERAGHRGHDLDPGCRGQRPGGRPGRPCTVLMAQRRRPARLVALRAGHRDGLRGRPGGRQRAGP